MSTWAIVPLKRLREAKSSLRTGLDLGERRELVLCMLADVLNALRNASSIISTIVVSPDDEVLRFAKENGAISIAEPGIELNEALKLAIRYAIQKGALSVLILPSDIPLLKAADIENIIAMASSPKGIVLAPSKDNGTNALFLKPPDIMDLRFGGESFPAHLAEARRVGVTPRIYRSASIATDIDDMKDLLSVETRGLGTRTHAFLRLIR
jgi:2-phospho-L-lactate guanylyltransferase